MNEILIRFSSYLEIEIISNWLIIWSRKIFSKKSYFQIEHTLHSIRVSKIIIDSIYHLIQFGEKYNTKRGSRSKALTLFENSLVVIQEQLYLNWEKKSILYFIKNSQYFFLLFGTSLYNPLQNSPMLHHIKHTIKNNKTILSNIFSLGTLQIFSYILPLITLPYITRVIWPEKYGIVAFAGAFVAYFLIFVNYGFNLTATRDISINREDKNKISEIFWNIISIKAWLGLIATIVSIFLIYSFDIFSIHSTIFLFSLLSILWEILFPVWMFQWMERMKYITLINVIVRTLFLIPIFVVIREVGDFMYLPLIASLSSITIWIIAFIMSVRVFQISFHMPTRDSLVYHMQEGWHVFVSVIAYGIYTNSPIFILWFFTNNTVVWHYAVAEKLIRALQSLIQPISQAIYPSVSQKLKISREATLRFLQKITIYFSAITIAIFLILFFGANTLVNILVWAKFSDSIIIIQILAFWFITLWIHNVMWVLIMLNFWYKKEFSIICIIEALFSITVSIPLIYIFQAEWLALSLLITEFTMTSLMWYTLYNKWINLFSLKPLVWK